MTKKTLIKFLGENKINPSFLIQYIAEHEEDEENSFRIELPKLGLAQLRGILKMCEPFKAYFEEIEYCKLVCSKVISYTKIHCAALSSFSKYEQLNVRSFANPNKELPEFLLTQCAYNGMASKCDTYGGPFVEIA